MLQKLATGAFAALIMLPVSLPATAQVSIPRELQEWRGWVLQDQEYRFCPFLASMPPANREAFRCAWPERLTLSITEGGGTFTQRWEIFAESWVQLPGSAEHWPHDVRVNGAAVPVVAHNGVPSLRLPPGSHAVTGALSWSGRPEVLPVDPRSAIVELTVDGRRIAQPERPDGAVSLGRRRSAEQPQRMALQVYRLVRDTVPVGLETKILMQVSGEGREELLPRVLPEGFVPLRLESSLPVRLEPDGRLRVQVRAGSWEITLGARGSGVASQLTRPETQDGWVREEVWSFAGEDRLRVAAVQGAEGIDPVQANVPGPWRGYPAFRMPAGATLTIVERTRGLENADDNQLMLFRTLWLDFDHRGMTAVDRIKGTMRRDWRLEMTAPFRLESARSGNETWVVTRSPDGERVGVEVRTPELDLVTTSRVERGRGTLPATGWTSRFEKVSGELILPPGHRLIAAIGADSAPTAWIDQWGMWGLFGVLVVAVFAGRLTGWPVGVIALAGLLLTYHDAPELIWLWANLLGAVALARVAPEGRLRRFARGYRAVSFFVLGVALLPFLWMQLRLAAYPQLEAPEPAELPQLRSVASSVDPEFDPDGEVQRDSAPPTSRESATPEEVTVSADKALSRRQSSQPAAAEAEARLRAQIVQRYAPGTLLQTGPGIPNWQYETYSYSWSGPVDAGQTVHFLYAGPILLGAWRITGAVLLTVLFLALLQTGRGEPVLTRWLSRLRQVSGSGATAAIFLILLGSMAAPVAQAANTPDPALLEELRKRLTKPPPCAPTCADIMSARVQARGDRLEVVLNVGALALVAMPVPSAGDRWQLDSMTIDGRSVVAIARERDGSLWLPVEPGAHIVRLAGSLAPAESIQLAFPALPRRISVVSEDWDAVGVSDGRLISGTLEVVRRRKATERTGRVESGGQFPAFVRVRRYFDLGLDWTMSTTVERVAPERDAFSVEVPLVAGESVLTQGIEVRESAGDRRVALVGLERGQSSKRWTSGLSRTETLTLEFPEGAARTEVWSFAVSPQWSVAFAGMPAVLPEDPGGPVWIYEFHPRPGEKLQLRVTRPLPEEGATLAVDSVKHELVIGRRSSTATLEFRYRSTQGGRHTVALPRSARVTAVRLDNAPLQLRPDGGELSIGLLPGEHVVRVEWTEPTVAGLRSRPLPVDLRSPTANVRTEIRLPADRWPLLAAGPGVGPVVLYWTELALFLPLAWLLGRWRRSPLKTHEWLLLGAGLSTLSWGVLVLVGSWLLAMRWRQEWAGNVSPWKFNAVQVLLAGLTFAAVGALELSGIREGLLARPDMGIAGPGSHDGTFSWFVDRTDSDLPLPQVISAPMWVYRALMFAWALWIVLALLRWLRWSWHAWKANGIWRGKVLPEPTSGTTA